MKKIYFLPLFLLIVLASNAQKAFPTKNAQGNLSTINSHGGFLGKMELLNSTGFKAAATTCPLELGDAHTYIAPPAAYVAMMVKKARETQAKSTFIVNYHDFPANAQQSFQRAVDIWSSLISSNVPIRIEAYYATLGDNVLGSANSSDFSNNFPGAQKAFTWYPMALAEKIANQDLNGIQASDIIARFNMSNSNLKWYFSEGTEKVAPSGTYDFTSVVLHEMGHGLGFVSSFDGSATDGTGNWGYGTGRPFVYDHYVVNGAGLQLIDTLNFKNNSTALKTQLIGQDVFLNNPRALAQNVKPKLYAPRTWDSGSSISHLDDATYKSGTINSLMTSAAKQTEINNNPGPIVSDFFADMGWKGTSLVHTQQKNIETVPTSINIKATIISDTTLISNSMKVFYLTNGDKTFTKTVDLTKTINTNEYTANIPIAATDTLVRYYLISKDNFTINNTYTSPPKAPTYYWSFNVGKVDLVAPTLEFYPVNIAMSSDKINFIADVEDNFAAGVDTVYIEYAINGAAAKTVGLNKLNRALNPEYSRGRRDAFTYLALNAISGLKNGDKIKYRIIAIDKAKSKNKATLPIDGSYFDLIIADPKTTAVASYENNFDSNTTDFAGVGFTISTPSGFTGSIQSDHPYTNGTGYGKETYRIMELLQPITIDSKNPIIKFDEIVLVEPNDNGGTYAGGGASGFYDYAVVQGSVDGGQTWADFADGINCRAQSDWLAAWNKSLVKDTKNSTSSFTVYNSTSEGTNALYHSREINMTSNSKFVAGNKVLIRFVLFSDELVNGWGWAIDNLKIQTASAPVITAVSNPNTDGISLKISPNPSVGILQINANLKQTGKVQMEVYNATGTKIMQQNYTADTPNLNESINLRNFSSGIYYIRLITNDAVLMKKFVVE